MCGGKEGMLIALCCHASMFLVVLCFFQASINDCIVKNWIEKLKQHWVVKNTDIGQPYRAAHSCAVRRQPGESIGWTRLVVWQYQSSYLDIAVWYYICQTRSKYQQILIRQCCLAHSCSLDSIAVSLFVFLVWQTVNQYQKQTQRTIRWRTGSSTPRSVCFLHS